MEYRNIFIANPAKLSIQRNQLVIQQEQQFTSLLKTFPVFSSRANRRPERRSRLGSLSEGAAERSEAEGVYCVEMVSAHGYCHTCRCRLPGDPSGEAALAPSLRELLSEAKLRECRGLKWYCPRFLPAPVPKGSPTRRPAPNH